MSQLELIPTELLPDGYRVPDDPSGRSTGERVLRDRPALYEAIVRALGEGMGIRQTARALEVHTDTVAAIRDREEHRVGTLKKATASNLRRFAAVASERLLEEVDKLAPLQLAIATGIAIDKSQLLDGSKRIEDLDALEAELVQAETTVSSGGTGGQKSLAAAGSDIGMSEARIEVTTAIVDDESTANHS
jgi:hypothetical protein